MVKLENGPFLAVRAFFAVVVIIINVALVFVVAG